MKEYNRQTRKWEEKTTGQGKFTQRDTCKGGRPHDYILSLPSYIKITDAIQPEAIPEYYLSEERRQKFNHEEDEKLASLGLRTSRWQPKEVTRYYRCVICDKRKYGL